MHEHPAITLEQYDVAFTDTFAVGSFNQKSIARKNCGQHAPSRHAEA
jgi:hypothetical protein